MSSVDSRRRSTESEIDEINSPDVEKGMLVEREGLVVQQARDIRRIGTV